MDYYQVCFGGLSVFCAVLLVSQPTRRKELERQSNSRKQVTRDDEHPESRWYKAYGLAMAADWLQGPSLFSLYRNEYGLDTTLVLNLYMTDFVSTAFSGYFIGSLSDKHGRKAFCMAYCLTYALSCLLTITTVTPLLFLGRVLGGISTSILFTVFDSWMVTNFHERKLAEDGCDLTRTYATTSVVNSLVAILSGLVGEILVWATGTRKSPFVMSVIILWFALQAIWARWVENYGTKASSKKPPFAKHNSPWSVIKQPSILALGFASTMFEGSINLFIFYWIPTLSSLHPQISSATTAEYQLPYGFIYSSFLAASMAASLAFNIIMDKRVITYTRLLVGILLVASLCFVKLAGPKTEISAFWLFCVLEACVGMYGPCVGYLKGRLIRDDSRATTYSLLRIPFNLLVIVSLLMARDNDHMDGVFATCSVMLTAAFATTWVASLRGMP